MFWVCRVARDGWKVISVVLKSIEDEVRSKQEQVRSISTRGRRRDKKDCSAIRRRCRRCSYQDQGTACFTRLCHVGEALRLCPIPRDLPCRATREGRCDPFTSLQAGASSKNLEFNHDDIFLIKALAYYTNFPSVVRTRRKFCMCMYLINYMHESTSKPVTTYHPHIASE